MFNVSRFFSLRTVGVVFGLLGAAICSYVFLVFAIMLSNPSERPLLTEEELAYVTDIRIQFTIYLVIAAIYYGGSMALIMGTIKESHLLIVPWLINHTILIGYSTLYYARKYESDSFISSIATIAFELWMWVVIYSLFKQIRNKRDQEKLSNKNDPERLISDKVVAELTPPMHEF